MSLSLDSALFYLYILALALFVALWLLPNLVRTLVEDTRKRLTEHRARAAETAARAPAGRPETRFEAFTRI